MRSAINATSETRSPSATSRSRSGRPSATALVRVLQPAFDAIAPLVLRRLGRRSSPACTGPATPSSRLTAWSARRSAPLLAAVPASLGAAVVGARQRCRIAGVEWLINRRQRQLNGLGEGSTACSRCCRTPRPDWPRRRRSSRVAIGPLREPLCRPTSAGRGRDSAAASAEIVASDPLGDFFGDVSARADANARDEHRGRRRSRRRRGARRGGVPRSRATEEAAEAVEGWASTRSPTSPPEREGPRQGHRRDAGRRLPQRRGGGRRVREDRQARRARASSPRSSPTSPSSRRGSSSSAPLASALSGGAGGGLGAGASPPCCTPAAWPAPGRCGSSTAPPSRAPRLHAGTPPGCGRTSTDDPAARRAGAEPARDRGLRAGALRRRRRSSTSCPATPRASGSRAPRSRATSPGRSPSDEGACDWRSTRSAFRTTSAAAPAAGRSGARRSSSSPPATRSATPPGPTRGGATTPPTASAAPTTSPRSSPSSRRGTAGCTASAGRTGATTSPACRRTPVTPIDQALGTGDGATTAFQLVKRYESGAQAWVRRIVKPVAGTVRVARGGVEAVSGWSVERHDRHRHLRGRARRRRRCHRRLRVRRAGALRHRPARRHLGPRAARLDRLDPAGGGAAMKSLSAALQAHLDSGTTTLAWCWRIERADGVVFGFTDHDRPLDVRRRHLRARVRLRRLGDPQRHRPRGRRAGRRGRADLGPHHRDRHPRRPLGQCRGRGLAGELERASASAC